MWKKAASGSALPGLSRHRWRSQRAGPPGKGEGAIRLQPGHSIAETVVRKTFLFWYLHFGKVVERKDTAMHNCPEVGERDRAPSRFGQPGERPGGGFRWRELPCLQSSSYTIWCLETKARGFQPSFKEKENNKLQDFLDFFF